MQLSTYLCSLGSVDCVVNLRQFYNFIVHYTRIQLLSDNYDHIFEAIRLRVLTADSFRIQRCIVSNSVRVRLVKLTPRVGRFRPGHQHRAMCQTVQRLTIQRKRNPIIKLQKRWISPNDRKKLRSQTFSLRYISPIPSQF